jgi:hypothetical protein
LKFLALVIAAMFLLPVSAYAQQSGPSRVDLIQANYSGPVFLDAFWTDRTSPPDVGTSLQKIEVAPGDGTSILAVTLVNRGFSEITSIRGTLELPAGFSAAGATRTLATHNGIVSAGNTFTLFFQVNVSEMTSVADYTALLHVEYSRTLETGAPRTAEISVPFKVTGKALLDASVNGGAGAGASGRVVIEISNTGSASATGVVVTVPGSSGINPTTQQASIVALGQKTFELGVIPAGGSATIEPAIYISSASGDTLQTLDLQVSYGNYYGERRAAIVQVGLVVLPASTSSLVSVSPAGQSSIITAGRIADLTVSITNNRNQELSDVVVSVSSLAESITILGNTSWTIGDMAPNSSQEISTKIFSSRDMIGRSTTFVFTIQHLSAGQSEIETTELGTYVDGEISIRAYDIGITYIGGRPNITGNLLNEGNVLALFTTVEIMSAEGLTDSIPPQQYLGDLTENSPLPFSIPIDVSDGTAAGAYPVELSVQYKDSLRESHMLDIHTNVNFVPEDPLANDRNDSANAGVIPAIIGGIVVAAVIVFVVIRMRKRNKLKRTLQFSKQNGGQDIESVLDTQLNKPDDKK